MKSIQNPFRSSLGRFPAAAVLAGSLLVVVPAHAVSIVRNNTANTLNTGTAWTGGTAPGVNDIATWNSSSVGGGQTLGGSVNWAGIFVGSNTPSSGPSFTNALNASPITVTLGASGINLNNGGASNRSVSFESNVGVVLGANQIWQLSAPTSNNTGNITVASVISGSGSLTVNRPITTLNYLSLSGANTFDGGLSIGSNGRVLVGAGSVVTGTTINSSPLGLGTVTINGPTTLATVGTTARDLAFSSLSLAGDMTIGETTTNTGRIRFTGAMDLNNGTRAITIAKGTATGTTANTSFGFAAIDGLNATVANGTLSLQSGATGGNKSWVNFAGANVVSFTNNAGLIIGNNVSTTFNSNFAFGNNNSDKIPNLTVQSGGTLDMSDQGGNFPQRDHGISCGCRSRDQRHHRHGHRHTHDQRHQRHCGQQLQLLRPDQRWRDRQSRRAENRRHHPEPVREQRLYRSHRHQRWLTCRQREPVPSTPPAESPSPPGPPSATTPPSPTPAEQRSLNNGGTIAGTGAIGIYVPLIRLPTIAPATARHSRITSTGIPSNSFDLPVERPTTAPATAGTKYDAVISRPVPGCRHAPSLPGHHPTPAPGRPVAHAHRTPPESSRTFSETRPPMDDILHRHRRRHRLRLPACWSIPHQRLHQQHLYPNNPAPSPLPRTATTSTSITPSFPNPVPPLLGGLGMLALLRRRR